MKSNQMAFSGLIIEGEQDSSLEAKTYKGIYAMHKYWSKKPSNLVADYVRRFSDPGDIILDSFCGSGVTVIESVRAGRRAVGIDINPIAIFITKGGLRRVDIRDLSNRFDRLKNEMKDKIESLYHTVCPKCGNVKAVVTHTLWNKGIPIELWCECKECKTKKTTKEPTKEDIEYATIGRESASWYPTQKLLKNSRINASDETMICDLFTGRAVVALSWLLETIKEIEDEKVKEAMELCFSATLPQASKMVFVIRRRGKRETNGEGKGRAEVGSWVIGYWVPKENFEINVWRCFENRFRRILAGKREIISTIPEEAFEFCDFEELKQKSEGYWVSIGNAKGLTIPSDSIDYVFIDPPHGNRVPYLELSLIFNSWLGFKNEWEKEIVISESRDRGKDIKKYKNDMVVSLSELWRVVKPGRYISVAFNSLNDDTWISMLNAFIEAGFEVAEIEPLGYSANSVVQDNRKNALKTDFIITCRKNEMKRPGMLVFEDNRGELENQISMVISNSDKGLETYEVLNELYVKDIKIGKIFRPTEIIRTLSDNFLFNKGHWIPNE